MTSKQSEPKTPLERFNATYTPLYRTLLILGGLSIIISIPSVLNLPEIIERVADDPIYAASGLVSIFVVLPLMISSLFLLSQKHPAGINLRLGGYAASVVAAVLGLFTSHDTIQKIANETLESMRESGGNLISDDLALQITEGTYLGALYISIFISVLFAWLWQRAWKHQMKSDHKKQTN